MENNNPPIPPVPPVPPNPNDDDVNKEFNNQFGSINPPPQNQQFSQQQNQGGGQNYNPPQQHMQMLPPVPNAVTSMVLGIIGLVFSVFWCYWVTTSIGLVLCIIALITGNAAVKAYNENPSAYAPNSLSNAKAGKIMGLIGMIIAVLWFLFTILIVVFAVGASRSMFRF
jgi:hypothetical protein